MLSSNKKTGGLIAVMVMLFSSTQLFAQNINNPNKSGPMGTQVNTNTGNLFIPRTDVHVPSRGVDIDLTFYYNAYFFEDNFGFGKGWTNKYTIFYKNDTAGGRTIFWGDGREDSYKLNGSNYTPPQGIFNALTQYQPNKFLVTELNGKKYYFDNSTTKRITKIQDPNGNVLNFTYSDTLLTTITNTAGQSISLAYNAQGNLSSVTDAITSPARTLSYTYDNNGTLKQVTDPAGSTMKYGYLVNGPMKAMTDKNNNTIDIIYYGDYSVSELIGCNKRLSFSYDTALQVTTVTDYVDGANQVTKYGYKAFGNFSWLSTLTGNCCGYNMSFEFDNNGNKIKETDANGNITSYTYDSKGNVLSIKDPLNQITSYTYSPDFNHVTSFTDAKGYVTTMSYNSTGNLTQVVLPGNLIYTGTYNANGDILTSTDPKGNVFTYTYDAFGRPATVNGPDGYHGTLSFDARGNLIALADAKGNTTAVEYDILDRFKKITDPVNGIILMNYDAEGNPVTITNQKSEQSHVKYDASNRPVEITDVAGKKTTVAFDGMNNVTKFTNAEGYTSTAAFDPRNRPTGKTDPLGNTEGMAYDAKGNIASMLWPEGEAVDFTYDALDRITKMKDAAGTFATFEYDKNNNITLFTNAAGASLSAVYDSINQIRQVTDPLGNTETYAYDKSGKIVSMTDRTGKTLQYTYDNVDRLKTVTSAVGGIVTLGYDNAGELVTLTDENNHITGFTFDSMYRVKRTTYPDARFMEFTYDIKGNVILKRMPDGTNVTFAYDTMNRVITKILPGGNSYSYTYDAIGRIKTAGNANGLVTLGYDGLNRLVSENYDGRTTRYNYNVSGRTQTTLYPDSTAITKSYDVRGNLISISKNNIVLVTYQYNSVNQVIGKTFANGVNTAMQYDFSNRLNNLNTASGAIQNTDFTYNNNQDKISTNRLNLPSSSEQYSYDDHHRIVNYKRGTIAGIPVIQNTYTYDALGNRTAANLNGTSSTYSINNLNQVTASAGLSAINYTYDNNGNLSYDGTFYKTYDAEKRLIKDSSSVSNVITYEYDALGRRTKKTINGSPLKYSYAGFEQIEERNGVTGDLNTRTIYNNFITPVVNEKNGNTFYYHQNELNSVEAISNAQGRLIERYEYDVYGQLKRYDSLNNILPSSIAGNRFAFTGQEYDSATNSYRFYFRNYNPVTGTFNQRDPIGYGDGTGMYQYVHDNPANGIDVFGLDDCDEPKPKSITDHITDLNNSTPQWYLSNVLSNLNSVTTVYQKGWQMEYMERINALMKYRSKASVRNTLIDLVKNKNALVNNRLLNALNGNVVGGILAPVNILGAVGSAIDVGTNWSGWDAGQRTNGAIGLVSSSTFAAVSTTQIVNGFSAVSAGGSFSTGFGATITGTAAGFTLVATAGGLAIYGVVNEAGKAFSGKSISEVSYEYDIPIITGTFRVLNGGNYQADPPPRPSDNGWRPTKPIDCPQNATPGGPRKRKYWFYLPNGDSTEVVQSHDPNAILGPDGEPNKHWVSVHDVLPYTVLYENSKSASAPAKFVRITYPIDPKQDKTTFTLGNFGFNNQTFTIPANTATYSQRLDARDSLGLYVDITAGLDGTGNLAFWEFQSIDPLTLLPPTDPLKGFLLLQDSAKQNNGHGFVNFSIKPKQTDITLDTIHAEAKIVFDLNDTIPTNYHMNTVDAFAPTSHMNALPATSNNPVPLSWGGVDDVNGCGLKYYTLYISTDGVNYNIVRSHITRTDTLLNVAPNSNFSFFVLATDSVGNTETLRPGEVRSTFVGAVLPLTMLYFRGTNQNKNNFLEWATATEQNTANFKLERSFTGANFTSITTVPAAGNSSTIRNYSYTDIGIDKLKSGVFYYRLKELNTDGSFVYSNIVKLNYKEKEEIVKSLIYPNPTRNVITLVIGDRSLKGTTANLYDMGGRLLEVLKITADSQTIDLGKYMSGTYYLKLSNKETISIIKL